MLMSAVPGEVSAWQTDGQDFSFIYIWMYCKVFSSLQWHEPRIWKPYMELCWHITFELSVLTLPSTSQSSYACIIICTCFVYSINTYGRIIVVLYMHPIHTCVNGVNQLSSGFNPSLSQTIFFSFWTFLEQVFFSDHNCLSFCFDT